MSDQVMLEPGMDVYGADGDKIGTINEVYDNYIMAEKGFFFPKDYYIPLESIEGVDADNRVYLLVNKNDALNQGWDTVPDMTTTGTGYRGQESEVIATDYV